MGLVRFQIRGVRISEYIYYYVCMYNAWTVTEYMGCVYMYMHACLAVRVALLSPML